MWLELNLLPCLAGVRGFRLNPELSLFLLTLTPYGAQRE